MLPRTQILLSKLCVSKQRYLFCYGKQLSCTMIAFHLVFCCLKLWSSFIWYYSMCVFTVHRYATWTSIKTPGNHFFYVVQMFVAKFFKSFPKIFLVKQIHTHWDSDWLCSYLNQSIMDCNWCSRERNPSYMAFAFLNIFHALALEPRAPKALEAEKSVIIILRL